MFQRRKRLTYFFPTHVLYNEPHYDFYITEKVCQNRYFSARKPQVPHCSYLVRPAIHRCGVLKVQNAAETSRRHGPLGTKKCSPVFETLLQRRDAHNKGHSLRLEEQEVQDVASQANRRSRRADAPATAVLIIPHSKYRLTHCYAYLCLCRTWKINLFSGRHLTSRLLHERHPK